MLRAIDETITESNIDAKFRVYYLYPDILTLSHIDELAKLRHFLPYFDIPFQHASERILKLMGRHYDRAHIDGFLSKIRSTFPDAFIRTAFIIGFPGETNADFAEVVRFVEDNRFESVGIFQYHDEPLAASSKLPNKVDEDTAKDRIMRLTPVLERIYAEQYEARKGKKQHGYIMEIRDDSIIVRPELHAPEVDEYDEVELSKVAQKDREIGKYISYTL